MNDHVIKPQTLDDKYLRAIFGIQINMRSVKLPSGQVLTTDEVVVFSSALAQSSPPPYLQSHVVTSQQDLDALAEQIIASWKPRGFNTATATSKPVKPIGKFRRLCSFIWSL
ncbi:MAG: hypothetical protein ABIR91_03910 [Candidatus Saccharimonadales bacterium]